LLTDSNPSSYRDGDNDVAVSHCSLYLKVMDDWYTLNKPVGCILHLPSVDVQVVEAYDELVTYD